MTRRPAHRAPLLLFLLATAGLAGCAHPTHAVAFPWSVEGEARLAGGSVALDGDITVAAGGRLVLQGLEAMAPPATHPILRIAAGGTLELVPDGGRPTRLAGPVRIVVEPGGALVATGAVLEQTTLRVDGTARLRDVRLDGQAEVHNGTLEAQGGTWMGPGTSILALDGASARASIDGTLFQDARMAVQATHARLALRNVTVTRMVGYGVWVQDGEAQVEGSNFTGNGDYGFLAVRSSVRLERDWFENHCGAFLDNGTIGQVLHSRFRALGHGLTLRQAVAAVAGNDFTGTQQAVGAWGSTLTLANNTLRQNQVGLKAVASNATLLRNLFAANRVAVDAGGAASRVELRNNSFAASVQSAVQGDGLAAVDARWNWWGSPDGPGAPPAELAVGDVQVAPWLSSDPADPS
jgi:hypothetical protein